MNISVDALLQLMFLKEDMEDPEIVGRICDILIPKEFTKLDDIVELVFFAAEEAKPEDPLVDEEVHKDEIVPESKIPPKAFHEACVTRVEDYLKRTLVKRTRTGYSTPDESLAIACLVSKEHHISGYSSYWFAFHPHQGGG